MTSHRAEGLTHVDAEGTAHMVNVTEKAVTRREARARGEVRLRSRTLALIRDNAAEKGDVLGVARVAGIMAAKRTSDLIPLCHGLPLSGIDVEFRLDDEAPLIDVTATAVVEAKTGVEMEALTAVTVAALTIYDMCKAVDREMRLTNIRLIYKSGGRSGTFQAEE